MKKPTPRKRRRRVRSRVEGVEAKGRGSPAKPRRPPSPPSVIDERLTQGIALFNQHQFFQCHEVLEQVWLKTTDPSKDFYKGLIQAAVAFYHWSKGNRLGALTVARSATHHLTRYQPVYCGVDVEGFLTQFSELFRWVRRHRQRFDHHVVPSIQWSTPPRQSTDSP